MRRSSRNVRHASSQLLNGNSAPWSPPKANEGNKSPAPAPRKPVRKRAPRDTSDDEDEFEEKSDPLPITKKRKTTRAGKNGKETAKIYERLFGNHESTTPTDLKACSVPARLHSIAYHQPLLLGNQNGRAALFEWFDNISTARRMPWRKTWVDPRSFHNDAAALRKVLEVRAYEVWISEIMLQQTRVAVVIDYWNRWMAKWPTIHELAAAEPDDVLAAWRGLGYYSRATRIHEAAKLICQHPEWQGLLPAKVDELVVNVAGVGRYTAGAISAIVFGQAAPMVDGNVLRVLSRQLGVFGDVKSDKSVIDLLWAAADAFVKAVARDVVDDSDSSSPEPQVSDRPGRWGQALMELGSTVCTPKPNCAACPISSTCLVYCEGLQLATKKGLATGKTSQPAATGDIEDACNFCKPFEEFAPNEEEDDVGPQAAINDTTIPEPKPKARKQATLQAFAFTASTKTAKKPGSPSSAPSTPSAAAMEVISNHARKFPVKVVKKAVREEETLVCAIRRTDGKYLIHRRPEKGLLAGLWEFPSHILLDAATNTPKARKREVEKYVSSLMAVKSTSSPPGLKHIAELGSVPWLFSHLKLTMHVHFFELDDADDLDINSAEHPGGKARWSDSVGAESMGTGMRKCWDLVKEAAAHS